MSKRIFKFFIAIIYFQTACSQENTPPILGQEKNYSYELIVDDISVPWGMAFIKSDELLVTEQSGILHHIKNGVKNEIKGLPDVYFRGQGGLLDIALHPNFDSNKTIFFTQGVNTENDNKGGNTSLYSGVIDGFKLTNVKLLYKATPNTKTSQHWGSRIVFDREGHIYFGIGDRGERDINPQDITRDAGKIYRLNLDGTIPIDNPFVGLKNVKDAIFSFGHRNPQGMTVHPKTGQIWEHEHGPRGGDEINIIKGGLNYGWPKITYGRDYLTYVGSNPLEKKTSLPGMEQPFYYWVPSIAPSGMAFCTSDVYGDWKDDLFVGSLKFEYLERLVIEEDKVVKREKILDGIGRVRNVVEGPDGYLYLGIEGTGIVKVLPAK